MAASQLKKIPAKQLTQNVVAYIAKLTGRDAGKIDEKTKLSDLGLDGFDVVAVGDKIDETNWLHGVRIPVQEWQNCNTVGDIVKVITKYI